jgi:hypothetical protein
VQGGAVQRARAQPAEPVVVGFDVAVLNGGGQIRSVYGFLDKVPG